VNLAFRDDEAEVFNAGPFEFAFIVSQVEFVLPKSFQDDSHDSVLFFERPTKDKDVI